MAEADTGFGDWLSHGRKGLLSDHLVRAYAYRRLRRFVVSALSRTEGGALYSAGLRRAFHLYHGVSIGMYSYGECFVPGAFPPGTTVGRCVSIAAGVRAFTRNHPMERLSLHPFFYNAKLGYVSEDTIVSGALEVGHDAWLGERAIITPGCHRIGIGAVVGAGAVVTRDVPDFAIVAGNPARVIRIRFADELCERILQSRWWEKSIDEIRPYLQSMLTDLTVDCVHPFLSEAHCVR